MPRGDLAFTVRERRLACVLDPALVLGHALGPQLALRLTQVLEPWLTRSFWRVVDASELVADGRADCLAVAQPDAAALSSWMSLRDRTDADHWPMRCVGDNLCESHLGDRSDDDVIDRFEWLLATLESRLVGRDVGSGDALALSACLGGAMVLCSLRNEPDSEPGLVALLARAGVTPEPLEPLVPESLFCAERRLLRELLAGAGLAPLLQQLPPLAVLHVIAAELGGTADGDDTLPDPWRGAHAWWYRV